MNLDLNYQFRQAKNVFLKQENQKTYEDMLEAFRNLVLDGTWVRFPCNQITATKEHNKQSIATVERNGKFYSVMFTCDEESRLSKGMTLVMTDINKGIEFIYNNPHIAGLAVDPFSDNAFYLDLSVLEYFSGIPNPRTQKVDWGEGVPQYEENDLMSEEELLDFGVQIVGKYLTDNGYDILETTNALKQPSNIAAKIDEKLCLIKVKLGVVDIKESFTGFLDCQELSLDETEALLKFARKHNAKAYFAPVSIGSADPIRMKEGIALYGDQYLIKFTGLTEM